MSSLNHDLINFFESIEAIRADLRQVTRPKQIKRLREQLQDHLTQLSDDELKAYGEYRRAKRA